MPGGCVQPGGGKLAFCWLCWSCGGLPWVFPYLPAGSPFAVAVHRGGGLQRGPGCIVCPASSCLLWEGDKSM